MAERDRRFGGNLARATEGEQYPSGLVTGQSGTIRVPMVDRRYEDYQAPHRVDYTSPRGPIQTGTPNFRSPSGDGMPQGIEQIPSGNYLQNYFNMIRNQAFGPEGPLTAAVPQDDWRTWEKILQSGGNPDDYEVETSDASDWINAITGTGQNMYDTLIDGYPFGIDPFEGSIGYDKQFDLPFGGTGNIGADYDLDDEEFNADLLAQWTWS